MTSGTSDLDNEVRLAVYRFFVDNARPPVAAEVAEKINARPVEVEESYRRLHDTHVLVLAPGTPYIWMANPFSAVPTPYTVEVGGKTYFGNCIWDSLGIVAMLGSNGSVAARCGDCGEDLSLAVTPAGVSPDDNVVHYAVPAAHWWDDIGFN